MSEPQGFVVILDVMSDGTFEEIEEAVSHAIENSDRCKETFIFLSIYPDEDMPGPIPIDSEGSRI